MPRSERYSFLQELANTPPIWPFVSAEQSKPESYCYPVWPHGKCRYWTQFHRSNFPCVIDACIFTCWNATFFSSSLFSILVWCNLIFRPIFFKPKLKLVRNAIRPLYMRFRATVRVYIIKVALNLMPTSSLTVQEEVLMSDFLDQRKIVLWKLILALTNNYLEGDFYQPIRPNRLNWWQKLFSYDVKPVNYHERKFARSPTVSGFSCFLSWPSFVSL